MIELFPIDANDSILEADLDGRTFYIGFSWNETAQAWTLSLRDLRGELLSSSIACVPFWPLLWQIRHPSHPPGELFVYLRDGAVLDREAFVRGDANVIYFEAAEMEEMQAA